jgi:hypothetical protein
VSTDPVQRVAVLRVCLEAILYDLVGAVKQSANRGASNSTAPHKQHSTNEVGKLAQGMKPLRTANDARGPAIGC